VPKLAFKYYIHDGIAHCRLQLLGELREDHLIELKGCWNTVRTTLRDRGLVLDLHGLRSADDAGQRWLRAMAAEGAILQPAKIPQQVETPHAAARPSILQRLASCFRSSRVLSS
jgi:hypothetical protein